MSAKRRPPEPKGDLSNSAASAEDVHGSSGPAVLYTLGHFPSVGQLGGYNLGQIRHVDSK